MRSGKINIREVGKVSRRLEGQQSRTHINKILRRGEVN